MVKNTLISTSPVVLPGIFLLRLGRLLRGGLEPGYFFCSRIFMSKSQLDISTGMARTALRLER